MIIPISPPNATKPPRLKVEGALFWLNDGPVVRCRQLISIKDAGTEMRPGAAGPVGLVTT